jgi:poly(A) polymerase
MLDTGVDRHRVSPLRPLVVGDLLAGRKVAGFAWNVPAGGRESTHLDDRLLLDGDEQRQSPPNRPVPQTAEGAEQAGAMPPTDLPPERMHEARSIDAGIPLRADLLLDLPGAAWQPLARPLVAAVHATGHRVWLAGGAARDVIAGVPFHEVNDLDLAGTVGPGRFTDITYQTLRALRMSEFRTTVTPNSLVCAVVSPWSRTRLIEYRGLSRGGFNFPAVGSSLVEDAGHRDFSFNALLYDVLDHVILDASGTGIRDLLADERRFSPLNLSSDPLTRAMILIRAVKFVMRWRGTVPLDLAPLHSWIAILPADFCRQLTRADWSGLTSAYRRATQATSDVQREFAAALPEPGRELVETLIGRIR